jgi:Zn-dependent protease
LPIVPLDGGRAMAALSPWMWFVGLFAIFVLVFLLPNPIVILIALVGAFEVWRRWKSRNENADYYRVSKRTRILVGLTYLALIVVLVAGMDATHLERDFDDL